MTVPGTTTPAYAPDVGRYRKIERATRDELAPLQDDETWVRVWTEMPDQAWQTIASWFADRPDLRLTIEWGADLEMLRFFTGLRRLDASSLRLRSLEGLRHVAGTLEELGVGDTVSRISLRPVEVLDRLRVLSVNGTWSDIDTIGRMIGLRDLGIGSIDLELLRPLEQLERLHSGLGTVSSLELLPEIGRISLIDFCRLRGHHDLGPLARMPHLRWLVLASTTSITALPSFGACPSLRWVYLDTMRGIRDLRPIAEAPGLEVLALIGLTQLEPEDLRPLVGHPTLRILHYGLGSARKNAAARAVLPPTGDPLRGPEWNWPDWDGTPHWNSPAGAP
jgi:hypothetical protein